jgi:tRNA threonylcarbamoyladenosine biosynthesis protein TsaB
LITLLIQDLFKDRLLRLSDIDAIAISHGPGSYTSLRVGASTAKSLSYTLDKPLIAIDALTILAAGVYGAAPGDTICPMIDARRMEVYMATYDHQKKAILPMQALILDDHSRSILAPNESKLHLCGSGAAKYYQNFGHPSMILHHIGTDATFMSELAYMHYNNQSYVDTAYYEPEYLKSPNITKSLKKFF